ncbi:MAG: hypothetical protein WCI73_08505 [Phycisphaerae bacterium]
MNATPKRKPASASPATAITGRAMFRSESLFALTITATHYTPAEITIALQEGRWGFRYGDEPLRDGEGIEIGRFEWGVESILEAHVDVGDHPGITQVAEHGDQVQLPHQTVLSEGAISISRLSQKAEAWVADTVNTRNSPIGEERRLINRLRRSNPDYRKASRIERTAMRRAVEKACWAEFGKALDQRERAARTMP